MFVGVLDGCVSVSMAVVPYKPEHVCRGACVPVRACLREHLSLSPNVGECLRTALCPETSGRTGAQGSQVAATEEPKAPGLAGKLASSNSSLQEPVRAPPGPAPGLGGRGRGGAGRGGGLLPLGLPMPHWLKVPTRHRRGSSSKVLCT